MQTTPCPKGIIQVGLSISYQLFSPDQALVCHVVISTDTTCFTKLQRGHVQCREALKKLGFILGEANLQRGGGGVVYVLSCFFL